MSQIEYRLWRAEVFKRDGYICALCRTRGVPLEANHIERWTDREDLRYDVNNGVTLCRPCHMLVTGHEAELMDRFKWHAQSRSQVSLTDAEKASYASLVTECLQCHAQITKQAHRRTRKFHFCGHPCRRKFEKRINANWRGLIDLSATRAAGQLGLDFEVQPCPT